MIGGGRTGRKPTDGPGEEGLPRRADAALLAGFLLAGSLACAVASASRRAELGPGAALPGAADAVRRVDLRTAGPAELRLLPGVGPRLAERIAAEREAGGPFEGLDDLERRVPGVGPARTRRWRGRVGESDLPRAAGEGSR